MTLANTTKIKCGHCGNEIEVFLYGSVNVDVSPHLKERVLSGNINSGFCDKCNTINRAVGAFLYHDMNLGLAVWVYPEQDKEQANEITRRVLKETQEVNKKLPKILTQLSTVIVVFGIDDLKEKLRKAGDLLRSELKLYAREKFGIKLIATLYVENNKLIIDSQDQKVKDDLYKEINALTENGGIFLFEYVFKNDNLFFEGALVNTDNSNFLYALKNCSYLWNSNKTYGERVIYGFDSSLFELKNKNNSVQYIMLGSSEKNPVTQKFTMKIFAHNHKKKEYASHILQRAVQPGPIHNFYRAITEEEKDEWSRLHFKTFNTAGKYTNDYAQRSPRTDFFECYLAYNNDEKAIEQCDKEKLSFLKELNKKYSPTEEQKRERETVLLERMLNLKLPNSYKQFLKKFGGGFNGKEPIVGKPRIFGLPANKEPTSVLGATFFLRIKRDDISKDFVVIAFLKYSYALCLDLRNKPENDAPLVKINYMDKNTPIEKTNSTFSSYLKASVDRYCNNK